MLTLQYTLLNIIYFALNVAVAGYGYNYLSSLAIFQVAGMIKTAEIGLPISLPFAFEFSRAGLLQFLFRNCVRETTSASALGSSRGLLANFLCGI